MKNIVAQAQAYVDWVLAQLGPYLRMGKKRLRRLRRMLAFHFSLFLESSPESAAMAAIQQQQLQQQQQHHHLQPWPVVSTALPPTATGAGVPLFSPPLSLSQPMPLEELDRQLTEIRAKCAELERLQQAAVPRAVSPIAVASAADGVANRLPLIGSLAGLAPPPPPPPPPPAPVVVSSSVAGRKLLVPAGCMLQSSRTQPTANSADACADSGVRISEDLASSIRQRAASMAAKRSSASLAAVASPHPVLSMDKGLIRMSPRPGTSTNVREHVSRALQGKFAKVHQQSDGPDGDSTVIVGQKENHGNRNPQLRPRPHSSSSAADEAWD